MPVYVLNKEEFEKYKSRTDLGIGSEMLSESILNMTGTDLIMDDEIINRFREIRCIHHKYVLIKPIKEYGGHEIVTCIHEKVLLEYVVPIMSRYLEVCPLTAGHSYVGEVLANILELDKTFWESHRDWYLYFIKLAVKVVSEYGLDDLRANLNTRIYSVIEKASIESF